MNKVEKRVFVVLGMSRSGTSAIAKALTILGVDLGEHLIAAKEINPTGVFEDADILYNVNRGVGNLLGNPWISTDIFAHEPLEMNPILLEYKNYATKILQHRFSAANDWGFKDPRTIVILPFWQSVFQSMQIEDSYVIAMRNPLASAYSNQKFAKMDIEESLLQWLCILISAINGTQGKKRVLVSYEAMLDDPRLQIERMQRDLKLDSMLNEIDFDNYVNNFLDKKLHHHNVDLKELQAHPVLTISPLCLRVYELLSRVANNELSLESQEFQLLWQQINNEFALVNPAYQYIKKLLINNRGLNKEIKNISRSVPWKILMPLRLLSNFLRTLNRRRKNKRRLAKIYE